MSLNAFKALFEKKRRPLLLAVICVFFPVGIEAQTLIFQAESEQNNNPPLIDVTESVPADASYIPPTSLPSTSPSSANSELLSMIEQLQEEVQALRGTVEEQAQQIRVLKKSAKSRYLDLDKRILGLTNQAAKLQIDRPVNPSVALESAAKVGDIQSNQITPEEAVSEGSVSDGIEAGNSKTKKTVSEEERRAYNDAYALVKARDFDLAIKEFYSFIDKFPDGDLAGNAYHWLGEVYLVLPQLEQAEQAFTIVVQAYENHPKVADALYKLGVTLDRMQKPKQSEEYLMAVQKRFPNSTASKLAKSYKINR